MTTENSEAKPFDVSKYQITAALKEHELTIEATGETFTIKTRPMSWSRKTKLMTDCVKFGDGSADTTFDADAFMRATLREIIVEAPWGRTTEAFLLSIDSRLGSALETLVPQLTGAGEPPDEIKKGA